MMTHRQIANRFKAGESVERIADALYRGPDKPYDELKQYVQHAIRQVLVQQEGRR